MGSGTSLHRPKTGTRGKHHQQAVSTFPGSDFYGNAPTFTENSNQVGYVYPNQKLETDPVTIASMNTVTNSHDTNHNTKTQKNNTNNSGLGFFRNKNVNSTNNASTTTVLKTHLNANMATNMRPNKYALVTSTEEVDDVHWEKKDFRSITNKKVLSKDKLAPKEDKWAFLFNKEASSLSTKSSKSIGKTDEKQEVPPPMSESEKSNILFGSSKKKLRSSFPVDELPERDVIPMESSSETTVVVDHQNKKRPPIKKKASLPSKILNWLVEDKKTSAKPKNTETVVSVNSETNNITSAVDNPTVMKPLISQSKAQFVHYANDDPSSNFDQVPNYPLNMAFPQNYNPNNNHLWNKQPVSDYAYKTKPIVMIKPFNANPIPEKQEPGQLFVETQVPEIKVDVKRLSKLQLEYEKQKIHGEGEFSKSELQNEKSDDKKKPNEKQMHKPMDQGKHMIQVEPEIPDIQVEFHENDRNSVNNHQNQVKSIKVVPGNGKGGEANKPIQRLKSPRLNKDIKIKVKEEPSKQQHSDTDDENSFDYNYGRLLESTEPMHTLNADDSDESDKDETGQFPGSFNKSGDIEEHTKSYDILKISHEGDADEDDGVEVDGDEDTDSGNESEGGNEDDIVQYYLDRAGARRSEEACPLTPVSMSLSGQTGKWEGLSGEEPENNIGENSDYLYRNKDIPIYTRPPMADLSMEGIRNQLDYFLLTQKMMLKNQQNREEKLKIPKFKVLGDDDYDKWSRSERVAGLLRNIPITVKPSFSLYGGRVKKRKQVNRKGKTTKKGGVNSKYGSVKLRKDSPLKKFTRYSKSDSRLSLTESRKSKSDLSNKPLSNRNNSTGIGGKRKSNSADPRKKTAPAAINATKKPEQSRAKAARKVWMSPSATSSKSSLSDTSTAKKQSSYAYNSATQDVNAHPPPPGSQNKAPAYGFVPHVISGPNYPLQVPHHQAHHQRGEDSSDEEDMQKQQQQQQMVGEDEEPEWSYERDRVYMMVLSSDEFLGRMVETDARVHTVSQAEEKEMHKNTIKDLLGLRGHLQDELLRIEQMLAVDDPKLKCLKQFEQHFPLVVGKLRELRNKSQIVRARAIQEELPPSAAGAAVVDGGSGGGDGSSSQTGKAGSTEAGTQSSKQPVITEEELKQKHVEEEQKVSENYADRLMVEKTLSQQDVDNLLQDHALSMQALRTRQDEERNNMQERMKTKLKQKMNKAKYGHETDVPGDNSSEKKTPEGSNASISEKDPFVSGSEEDEEESDDEQTEVLRDTMWNKMTLSHKMTAENLKDMVDSFAKGEEKTRQLQRRSTKSRLSVVPEVNTPRTPRPTTTTIGVDANSNHTENLDKNTMLTSTPNGISTGTDAHGGGKFSPLNTQSSADPGTTTEDDTDNEQVKSMLNEDQDFVDKYLGENTNGMSPEDYAEFMEKYLNDRDKLRKLKQQENKKLKDRMKKKLEDATTPRSPYTAGGDDRADYSDDFESDNDEFTDTTSQLFYAEEAEELERLKKDFLEKLAKKREKKNLSEEDVKKLLERYRKDQIRVIKERSQMKNKLDDKMKAKLDERLKNRKSTEETLDDMMQSGDDDSVFFAKLQQMQTDGELTKDQFSEMLKTYLDKKKLENRRKRKQTSHDVTKDKQAAAELVQIYNKEKQEVVDLRRAQKEKTDALLKKRLQAKKGKKPRNNRQLQDDHIDSSVAIDSSYVDSSFGVDDSHNDSDW